MQFPQKLLLPMTGAFIALSCMQISCGRALPDPKQSLQIRESSLPEIKTNSKETLAINSNKNRRHIVRTAVKMPFEFETIHVPCDLDALKLELILPNLPNHCIWLYNNRYVDEFFYRGFKLIQLESFFFGQYYERLKRYEMDPHNF
ncbi:uncharacterized protein LOC117785721 [Drosophila innubila]|uniref:uncharacterized protein LOC117785721 n=1 Tax=Drosophila innubila TaxID=198719 RepID=UPI00148C11D9|nr:uncharacterized protein LOC117785721 [Drosophila innubila]